VVDRVQAEVPGTLLLAEAFWLLEGYFVRTLGMHRVYNSAFMVMLRDEENAKYRSYLKKTIEFDPDIMKRYVNFMSNPDEKTAIEQFGTGDKYFGVATMMATIPGLPMFAHGQIEAYTEKYGMEYKQAKFDEWPNDDLVARHQKQIAPLLANRALFAGSENFVFFDFWTEHGSVDENVFAYSNRLDDERALIIYNNAYSSTRGTVHISAASMNKWTGNLWQRSLAEALGLPRDGDFFAYRDTATGLEYLHRANQLHNGLSFHLRGYQYVVLLHWRELRATAEQPWDQLCDGLNGAGVHSLDEALTRLRLRPLTAALRRAVGSDAVRLVSSTTVEDTATSVWAQSAQSVFERWLEIDSVETTVTASSYVTTATQLADAAVKAVAVAKTANALPPRMAIEAHPEALWTPLLMVAALRALPDSSAKSDALEENVIDRLHLRSSLAEIFSEVGVQGEDAWRGAARVRLALLDLGLNQPEFWALGDVQWLIGVNEHGGVLYLNKESLEQLLQWLKLVAADYDAVPSAKVLAAAQSAGYRFDAMVELLVPQTAKAAAPKPAVKKSVAVKAAVKKPAVLVKKAASKQAKNPVEKQSKTPAEKPVASSSKQAEMAVATPAETVAAPVAPAPPAPPVASAKPAPAAKAIASVKAEPPAKAVAAVKAAPAAKAAPVAKSVPVAKKAASALKPVVEAGPLKGTVRRMTVVPAQKSGAPASEAEHAVEKSTLKVEANPELPAAKPAPAAAKSASKKPKK